LVACLTFSVSKPFRLPCWTNVPFFVSLCLLFAAAACFVFLPSGLWLTDLFILQAFEIDGESYYDYRAWVAVGVLFNAILTFGAE